MLNVSSLGQNDAQNSVLLTYIGEQMMSEIILLFLTEFYYDLSKFLNTLNKMYYHSEMYSSNAEKTNIKPRLQVDGTFF